MSEGNGGDSSSWDLVTEIDRVLVREYAAHCCYWVDVRLSSGKCGDQCLLHGVVGPASVPWGHKIWVSQESKIYFWA